MTSPSRLVFDRETAPLLKTMTAIGTERAVNGDMIRTSFSGDIPQPPVG